MPPAPAIKALLDTIHHHCPGLSDTALQGVGAELQVLELPARQVFIRQGDIPTKLAYVARGLLKAVYTDSNGEQVNVNFFREHTGAGDYHAMRNGDPARYDFVAVEASTLVLMPFTHFNDCCRDMPELERFYRIMLEQALFAHVRRTERFLITKAERRYQDFMQDDPDLFSRLSVSDLCSYLGIRRQTLTAIRKKPAGN